MENKSKAVFEVLGYRLNEDMARRLFINVYEFLLYNDSKSFLETLEFRMQEDISGSGSEDYQIFKFMLVKMLHLHPGKLAIVAPGMAPVAA